MIRTMCEQFVARAAEPFRLDELWPFAERLERYGHRRLRLGRRPGCCPAAASRATAPSRAFRDDPAATGLGAIETTSVLVHLRRPSRLSTLQPPDTQPFDDPAGRFAFSHNGDLRDYRAARERYRAQGRIHGRADSEVGERWLEDAWPPMRRCRRPVDPSRLGALHDAFGGEANLAVLTRSGAAAPLRGQSREPGVHVPARDGSASRRPRSTRSTDRCSATPPAAPRIGRLARLHTTVTLDEAGRPVRPGQRSTVQRLTAAAIGEERERVA